MAWKSWRELTAENYMDISYISQADENTNHIRGLLFEYLGVTSEYSHVDVSLGYQTQPLPDYLNKIERNIDNLWKQIPWIAKRQESRVWLGEYLDNPTFRYSDVNRWFSDLLIMKYALDSIPVGWRRSGTFSCGNNYLLQILRR